MRRGTYLIFINAMILIVVFCLLAQSLVIIQRLASAEKIQGTVEVSRGGNGKYIALAQGSAIKTGDVVRTGSDGQAEFKWVDGTRWKVMPNTLITVKKSVTNIARHADYSELGLTSGKVFIRIMKALTAASRFEVETPTAVAAVRGTIFSVEVKDGQTQVAVFKGQVQVRSGETEAQKLIEPGQAAVSARRGALQTVSSAGADAEFARQSSIVLPELVSVDVKSTESGKLRVSGYTEAGDHVTVNGVKARVRGDGRFDKSFSPKPGEKTVTVVTTDRHGVSNTVVKPLNLVFPGVTPVPPPPGMGNCPGHQTP